MESTPALEIAHAARTNHAPLCFTPTQSSTGVSLRQCTGYTTESCASPPPSTSLSGLTCAIVGSGGWPVLGLLGGFWVGGLLAGAVGAVVLGPGWTLAAGAAAAGAGAVGSALDAGKDGGFWPGPWPKPCRENLDGGVAGRALGFGGSGGWAAGLAAGIGDRARPLARAPKGGLPAWPMRVGMVHGMPPVQGLVATRTCAGKSVRPIARGARSAQSPGTRPNSTQASLPRRPRPVHRPPGTRTHAPLAPAGLAAGAGEKSNRGAGLPGGGDSFGGDGSGTGGAASVGRRPAAAWLCSPRRRPARSSRRTPAGSAAHAAATLSAMRSHGAPPAPLPPCADGREDVVAPGAAASSSPSTSCHLLVVLA